MKQRIKYNEKGEISGYVLLVGFLIAFLLLGLTINITGRTQAEYAAVSASQTIAKQISAECQRYYQSINISCRLINDISSDDYPFCFSFVSEGNQSWSCRWNSYYDSPSHIAETIQEMDNNQINFGGLYVEIRGDSNRATASIEGCATYAIYPFPRWCGTKTVSFYL